MILFSLSSFVVSLLLENYFPLNNIFFGGGQGLSMYPCWPGAYYVDQIGLELTEMHLPLLS